MIRGMIGSLAGLFGSRTLIQRPEASFAEEQARAEAYLKTLTELDGWTLSFFADGFLQLIRPLGPSAPPGLFGAYLRDEFYQTRPDGCRSRIMLVVADCSRRRLREAFGVSYDGPNLSGERSERPGHDWAMASRGSSAILFDSICGQADDRETQASPLRLSGSAPAQKQADGERIAAIWGERAGAHHMDLADLDGWWFSSADDEAVYYVRRAEREEHSCGERLWHRTEWYEAQHFDGGLFRSSKALVEPTFDRRRARIATMILYPDANLQGELTTTEGEDEQEWFDVRPYTSLFYALQPLADAAEPVAADAGTPAWPPVELGDADPVRAAAYIETLTGLEGWTLRMITGDGVSFTRPLGPQTPPQIAGIYVRVENYEADSEGNRSHVFLVLADASRTWARPALFQNYRGPSLSGETTHSGGADWQPAHPGTGLGLFVEIIRETVDGEPPALLLTGSTPEKKAADGARIGAVWGDKAGAYHQNLCDLDGWRFASADDDGLFYFKMAEGEEYAEDAYWFRSEYYEPREFIDGGRLRSALSLVDPGYDSGESRIVSLALYPEPSLQGQARTDIVDEEGLKRGLGGRPVRIG